MKITLSLPPTDNQLYRINKGGKGMRMTQDGKDWKLDAGIIAKSEKVKYTEEPVIVGEIHFYLKYDRDIQGSMKIMFDSLEGIYYKNDKQVIKFGPVFKHKDKANPRIELFLN